MYTTLNNNNGQVNNQESPVWNQPHQIIIERWTKPRSNRDGNGSNRGILLKSTIDGSNKWLTLWSGHHIFRDLKWGASCYYDPNFEPHERLKIGIGNQSPPPIDNSQARADYYNQMAEPPRQQSTYPSSVINNMNICLRWR